MPRQSKAVLPPEAIQELEDQFFQFINSLSPQERTAFFSEFLTNEEKMMMYKRLALFWSLLQGNTLAHIQRTIGVTHDTTRLYNKRKATLSDSFKNMVMRIGKSELVQQEPVHAVAPVQSPPEPQQQAEQVQRPEAFPQSRPEIPQEHAMPEEQRPSQVPTPILPQPQQAEEEQPKKKSGLAKFLGF